MRAGVCDRAPQLKTLSTAYYLFEPERYSLYRSMIANLNNHILTTRRIVFAYVSREVQRSHHKVTQGFGVLIYADEIYDYLSCHDAIITQA